MRVFIISQRVLMQLKGDKKFLAVSLVAPLIIIYFLKLLFDSMFYGEMIVGKFAIPIASFIVHFLSFLLCAILLVQERTMGTLERMFISGFKRRDIVAGYTIGYIGLATLQAGVVLFEAIWLFDLNYDFKIIALLFFVIWLLAVVSVMLGIFISTFARHEGQVFPFIPLIILPSLFLSGLLIEGDSLPLWAELLGKLFPLHYANNIIQEAIKKGNDLSNIWKDFTILIIYAFGLLLVASKTLKEAD